MKNRLTNEEELDFIELNELRDYADYIREKVEFDEMPLALTQWRQTENS